MAGSQDFAPDPRNADLKIWLNGTLVSRAEAKVSVFDAGFVLGDGIWEGLRLHRGRLLFQEAHLDRLYRGATSIALDLPPRAYFLDAMVEVLAANDMHDGAHLRLMVTRGEKRAANQDPRNALGVPTVVVLAEYKQPTPNMTLRLHTSTIRTTSAQMFDMRINSHSRLPLILALNEAIAAGADEALMLDPQGNIASCNATNFFWVRDGEVRTSSGDYCFNGVTRANVIALCEANGIPLRCGDFAPSNLKDASEAFVTGTFGGLTPVSAIDGRALSTGQVTSRLKALYEALKDADA
ncbi:aminotransferase class IV [Glacieibacterium frigidum]|uniref:Probable branched-chain-amino-acid aminotransferase n=1 Tax=Glacieibacterium frigidum TaxID=2593303 RepID=A0A552UHW3_9SPHN|nr:aminotransferase class IV [Glacieibacterium frigidum]TRW17787.1 aminotransferase class IV [Glacieibacterium frigidum]